MVATEATKVDDYRLQDYELVLIVSPEVGDEALDATIDNVSKFITGSGGTISNVERWGKRRLAYPIKHFREGSYVLTQFRLKPVLSKEFETNLRISEEVLRHLLVKLGS
ncbi:MAG TPA: 30S ribosomal protein S6 [Dehalococcoidia bacterium]|nr:30S ribosomal protein S6 [Dehalococcoidia bacterium]